MVPKEDHERRAEVCNCLLHKVLAQGKEDSMIPKWLPAMVVRWGLDIIIQKQTECQRKRTGKRWETSLPERRMGSGKSSRRILLARAMLQKLRSE